MAEEDAETQKEQQQQHNAEEEQKSHWCVLESKSPLTEILQISPDTFTFGRNASNNKVISDSKISAKHCALSREKTEAGTWKYYIEDLSSNGTYHNGKKIGKKIKVELKDGDEIALLRTDKESDGSTDLYALLCEK